MQYKPLSTPSSRVQSVPHILDEYSSNLHKPLTHGRRTPGGASSEMKFCRQNNRFLHNFPGKKKPLFKKNPPCAAAFPREPQKVFFTKKRCVNFKYIYIDVIYYVLRTMVPPLARTGGESACVPSAQGCFALEPRRSRQSCSVWIFKSAR